MATAGTSHDDSILMDDFDDFDDFDFEDAIQICICGIPTVGDTILGKNENCM